MAKLWELIDATEWIHDEPWSGVIRSQRNLFLDDCVRKTLLAVLTVK